MLTIAKKIGEGFKSLFALVFPMFAAGRSASAEAAHPLGRWAARVAIFGLLLYLLWLLNQAEFLGLREWVPYGRLGEYWLPLLTFCLYAMSWLGWWLYRVLSLEIEPLSSEYPDIDAAWAQAMEALAKADIHLETTPLFLVVGWNAASEDSLFQAAGLRTPVRNVPSGQDEPLHVTATRDGIWVTCPGASELSRHDASVSGPSPELTLSALVDEGGDPNRTIGAGAGATIRIEDIVQGDLMKALERHRQGNAPRKLVDTETYQARLRHLCRLISRDRQGFCPINGVLVLLPLSATDPKTDIQELAGSCRNDLTTALETFRVRCTILYMVCNLEKLTGFDELVERLPAGQVRKRFGQRFPLVPDVRAGEVPGKVQGALEWVGETLFPSMVYSLLKVETAGGEDLTDVMRANGQLFRFLTEFRDRQERLTRLLRDCIPSLPGDPVSVGGFYFAGSGDDSSRQAFVSGVLTRMIQDQDRVKWTSDYVEEDASFLRLARLSKTLLSAFIALGTVVALVLISMLVFRGGGPASGPDAGESPP